MDTIENLKMLKNFVDNSHVVLSMSVLLDGYLDCVNRRNI